MLQDGIAIEVATLRDAMRVAERLDGLRVEIRGDGTTYLVSVIPDREENELRIVVLDAVEQWLGEDGLDSARVAIDGRTYVVHAPAGAPPPAPLA